MRWSLIISLAVLLAGVVVAQLFIQDPGFVVVGYHGQLIRTGFSFFVLVLGALMLGLFILGFIAFNMVTMPRRIQQRSYADRLNKAHRALHKGMLALAEGAWRRAEDSLVSHAAASRAPVIHYLSAARAAQSQHALERRDGYLRLAHEIAPRADLAIRLTQAELQLQQGELAQARETLEQLRSKHSHHAQVSRLCLKLYRELGEWDQVLELLPGLKQRKVLPPEELAAVEIDAYQALLHRALDAEVLGQCWSRIPTALREDGRLLEVYATRLHRYGKGANALPVLDLALRALWRAPLVRLYGLIDSEDRARQITTAEAWLSSHGEDPDLLLTLGRLCLRNGLWGKARYYLEASIQKAPSPQAYRFMSETLEHIGDKAAAAVLCRKGLLLATDFPNQPPDRMPKQS